MVRCMQHTEYNPVHQKASSVQELFCEMVQACMHTEYTQSSPSKIRRTHPSVYVGDDVPAVKPHQCPRETRTNVLIQNSAIQPKRPTGQPHRNSHPRYHKKTSKTDARIRKGVKDVRADFRPRACLRFRFYFFSAKY